MNIYKHIVYNPHMRSIKQVIDEAQGQDGKMRGALEWKFERSQPVTEYEWVAIFEQEITLTSKD